MLLPFFLMSVRRGTIEKIDFFELSKINFCEEPSFFWAALPFLNDLRLESFFLVFVKEGFCNNNYESFNSDIYFYFLADNDFCCIAQFARVHYVFEGLI